MTLTAFLPPSLLSGLSDVSVSPGVGINGYPLIWNNTLGQWVASLLQISSLTGGPLPLALGGTNSANGSITGTGSLTFAAGGTNQGITLSPSGNGPVNIPSRVLIQGLTVGLGGQTAISTNIALGLNALNNASLAGEFNLGIGRNTLASSTTGNFNSAIGVDSLLANTVGVSNTTIGPNTLRFNTTGSYGLALGTNALQQNTAGSFNTAIGTNALLLTTTGNNNLAVSFQALNNNTTGSSNLALGVNALRVNTAGSFNTAIGSNAGNTITTGSSNIAIGNNAQVDSPTANGQINIGGVYFHNRVLFTEVATDPEPPSFSQAFVFARDNGSGKTQICVRFNTGAVQVLATEA